MENFEEHRGILLHVEDDGSIRAAKEAQGRRGREQTQAGIC